MVERVAGRLVVPWMFLTLSVFRTGGGTAEIGGLSMMSLVVTSSVLSKIGVAPRRAEGAKFGDHLRLSL